MRAREPVDRGGVQRTALQLGRDVRVRQAVQIDDAHVRPVGEAKDVADDDRGDPRPGGEQPAELVFLP